MIHRHSDATAKCEICDPQIVTDYFLGATYGTLLTTPASDDVLPIVDTSETLTKKITLASLFGSIVASLVAAAGSTYSIGSASVRWLKGWFDSLAVTNIDGDVNVENVYPKTDNTYTLGSTMKQWANVVAAQITLGGIGKTEWPSAVAGSNGAVIQSGAVTLLGQDGVTVTHNHGSTSYLVKTNVTGLGNLGRIGDIAYVKAANTVVIYNSGISGISADVEISAVA